MTYPVGLSQIVEFRKYGSLVQLIAKNTKYTATPGTPEARAVAAGFSDSLLAAAPVVSQPHPERKSVLIDANALFMSDLPGAAIALDRIYRQSYSFDSRNSTIVQARAMPDMATFDVNAHYSLSRPAASSSHGSGPSVPSTLPDVRSMFLGFHYTLAQAARRADAHADRRRADRLFHGRAPRLHQRHAARAGAALRHPLAPREEGSRRRALRAQAADRVLARPQHPGEVPRRRSARASSSGTRRSSASASRTRSRSRSSPTTRTSTPAICAMRRCAGRRSRARRTARSARR